MNWLSHIGKQASRPASLELFRYIGPGFFWSQIALSLQLPFTIIPLILLTSSGK